MTGSKEAKASLALLPPVQRKTLCKEWHTWLQEREAPRMSSLWSTPLEVILCAPTGLWLLYHLSGRSDTTTLAREIVDRFTGY